MVTISCAGKLHAFSLAEQLSAHHLLDAFYTSYAYQKNTWLRGMAKRTDKEVIPVEKIRTSSPLAFPMKLWPAQAFIWNDLFDRWVAWNINQEKSRVFIGWSGMSLRTIKRAKSAGKITIVERGSAHILYQNEILKEEYGRFGIRFSIDQRVINKELQEYEAADYISIPSRFVYDSFVKHGIAPAKLLKNMYGASDFFTVKQQPEEKQKFIIVYLGKLSIQKGIVYLLEALHKAGIGEQDYEAWFIGGIDDELKETIAKFKKPNWTFFGHVDHYKLPELLNQCSIAVQPSLQDGMGMVIPQCLACGVPVIASENCGGAEIIIPGKTGYVVPVRSPEGIADAILQVFHDRPRLAEMKHAAVESVKSGLSWVDYGNRYAAHLAQIMR